MTPSTDTSSTLPQAAARSNTAAAGAGSRNGRSLAAMLLAAVVSALIVVADSVVDSYAEGHLLMGWITLWAVGFAALALFADTARRTARRISERLGAWKQRRAQERSDAYLLALAQSDPRIMADLWAATGHAASLAPLPAELPRAPSTAARAVAAWATRRRQARADTALWLKAQRDPRVMAEVQAAMERADAQRQLADQARGRAWLSRHPVGTFNAGYQGPHQGFRTTPLAGLPTHMQYLPS